MRKREIERESLGQRERIRKRKTERKINRERERD